ncbi:MAG: glycosyl hydrolase-related protein [Armatimonadota bacterium]
MWTEEKALVHNEKPFALSFFPSSLGNAPKPFVELNDGAVNLTTAKLAENGDSLIIRLFEPTGKARSSVLSLPFCGIRQEVNLSAFEIKTLRIDVASASVEEADLVL